MSLTTQQLAALKADILLDPVLAAKPLNSDGAFDIAGAYNAFDASFMVYRTAMPTQEIFDQVLWANLTPADTPDTTQVWMNRALACQGKQFNIQTMLTGRTTLDVSKTNVRAGLQDALTQVPSGAAGVIRSAGWVGVRDAMPRLARRVEKLFATGTGTLASPATMTFEGTVSYQDVESARNS